jgi:hypothetical protein
MIGFRHVDCLFCTNADWRISSGVSSSSTCEAVINLGDTEPAIVIVASDDPDEQERVVVIPTESRTEFEQPVRGDGQLSSGARDSRSSYVAL